MQLLKNNKTLLTLFILIIVSTTTWFGYELIPSTVTYLVFVPAAGFSLGFYIIYDKDALSGIVLGLFIGQVLSRIFTIDEEIWFSFMYGSILVIANLIYIKVYKMVMDNSSTEERLVGKGSFVFIVSVTFSSFVYAIITSSFYIIFKDDITFLQILMRGFTGHIYSGLLFGSIMLLSKYYDKEDDKKTHHVAYTSAYFVIFILLSILIFKDFGLGITYTKSKYVFLILFYIPAFVFRFKQMIIIVMLYLTLSHALYLHHLTDIELGPASTEINIALIVIFLITMITRIVLLETERKNNQLIEANDQMEEMIDSTFTLFKLGEKQKFQETFNSTEYLADLFKAATKIFKNYDAASCYLKGNEFVQFIGADNYNLESLNNFKFRVEDFIWAKEKPQHVVESSKMVKQSLKSRYPKFLENTPELKETIRLSIFIGTNQIGGMSFDIFTNSDKRFSKLDFENVQSFQKLINTFYQTRLLLDKNDNLKDDIVMSLIRTLELYDQYTGGHSEEVAKLSKEIAVRMNLSTDDQYQVFWAGIVHDIGKVGIPSEILNKPDRLSLEEYEIIKAHPGFGYEILKKSLDLQNIAILVKHHHEWWNGAGYPDGLKATEIPLGSRIISCADAVSSMATKRPYTQIKTSQEILKELKLYKGSQFAPDIADEMIKFIEEGELDKFYLAQHKL